MPNTFVEINLKNLRRNFLNIRKKAGNRKILAVVKADAYGHGMVECVNSLMGLGAKSPDYYGVAMIEEGIELRKKSNLKKPVLCFAPFQINDLHLFQKYDIIPTISDALQVRKLLKTELRKPFKVHINIDTGMGLTGISYETAFKQISALACKKNLIIDGIYTIFPAANKKDKSFALLQVRKIKELIDVLRSSKIKFGIVHAANSAALLNLPEGYFDMIRTGSSLYGFYPSDESAKPVKIYPVLILISRISVVKRIKKGESVGFGRAFVADRDLTIATVPVGYADGFKRGLSNNFSALIKGKFFPQIGNVSMDRIAFNLENDKILTGEKVVLIGKGGNKEITLRDWAIRLNTIPYEISCSIGQRIPRIYKK